MPWPFHAAVNAWKLRRSLEPVARGRLERLRIRLDHHAANPHWVERTSLALARFVALDLETTGPNMARDRIISIGAIGVTAGRIRHDDAHEVVLRQRASSEVDNILVHRIGGQEQLAGVDPRLALMDLFDYVGDSAVVAFRSEFDETVLTREVNEILAMPQQLTFLDLAVLLPSVFPGTQNDSLDDWSAHFGLHTIGRHQAIADAYTNAQLLLLLLDQVQRDGTSTVGALIEMERAQKWLGKRR